MSSIKKCKRKVRIYYQRIVDYPAGCGHHMLRIIRPDMYVNLDKWWGRWMDVDPDCPPKPKWL